MSNFCEKLKGFTICLRLLIQVLDERSIATLTNAKANQNCLSDGWETNGLLDHFLKKAEFRVKLETKLKSEGKSLEDAIFNRFVPRIASRKRLIVSLNTVVVAL